MARLVMFVTGIACMTLGIALSLKADLGTTPISSVPWVLSMFTPWTVGQITIVMNVLFIAVQPLILRAFYWRELAGQLVTTLFFGNFIDGYMYLLRGFTPEGLTEQWAVCLLSSVILGFGVFLEVRAKISLAAGEGLVMVLAFALKKKFSLLKNCFDLTLVAISIAIAFCEFGQLKGIGAGTVTAAILVGRCVYAFEKTLHIFDRWKVDA